MKSTSVKKILEDYFKDVSREEFIKSIRPPSKFLRRLFSKKGFDSSIPLPLYPPSEKK